MISMFFSAIAHMTGWPPNVIPWVNIDVPDANGSKTLSVVMTAPIDAYADDSPLAEVTMSGLMSYLPDPNHSPSWTKPQMTSSATSRIPYLSQIARTPGQYSGVGGAKQPPAFWTGSMITIATVSGPSWMIASSRSSSRNFVNCCGVSSAGRW